MNQPDLDLEHYRTRLQTLLAELENDSALGGEAARPVELDQSRVGRLSRMDALGAQAMSQASQRRRQELMQRARAALQRIETGDYGRCLECDEPIDPRRLDFDPTVAYCIACASRLEQ